MPHGPPRIRLADGRMNVVGVRLKERRLALNISQDQLCGRVAAITEGAWIPTRHDIYRIETGTRTVSELETVALAVAVDREVDWLIRGEAGGQSLKEFAAKTFRNAFMPAVKINRE